MLDKDTFLQHGATVKIDGVKKMPEVNGTFAIVEDWREDLKRWRVRSMEDGKLKAVKASNLEVIEPSPEMIKSIMAEQQRAKLQNLVDKKISASSEIEKHGEVVDLSEVDGVTHRD